MILSIALTLAAQGLSKQDRAAIMQTPQQIAATASVTGQAALDPYIWVDTRNFLRKAGNDRWFRARIDKATGEVQYQFYVVLEQRRQDFGLSALTYANAGGLAKQEFTRVDMDVQCQRYGCGFTEDAVAVLPRADLEYAAQGAVAGQDITWAAKLFGDSQEGVQIDTLKTEIAGFLLAVDSQIERLKAEKAR